MSERVFNFNPGPSTLPLEVLKEAQKDLLNYANTGMSVMEVSHRSKEFQAIVQEAEEQIKELLGLGDDHRVLFLHGGASTQFSMIPQNFLTEDTVANYIVSGSFAQKAYKESVKVGQTHLAGSTKDVNHNRIVGTDEVTLSDNPAYVHITSNNTIFGTQWKDFPDFGDVPLIADMSSDILSKPFDASKFALIYAGAQKNLGPSGVAVVIIRKDMLEKVPESLPSMLRYDIMAENNSLYNTPPSFSIYMVNLVLKWIKKQGGLEGIAAHNEEKAGYVYDAIDNSDAFYAGHAEKPDRSLMNITFRLPNEDLEKTFVTEAAKKGLAGLKGHRSVGGIRASIYNAMTKEGCKALADFMDEFRLANK